MIAFNIATSAGEEYEFNDGEGTWADRTRASQTRVGDKAAERQRRSREAETESTRTQGRWEETDTEGRKKAVAISSRPVLYSISSFYIALNVADYIFWPASCVAADWMCFVVLFFDNIYEAICFLFSIAVNSLKFCMISLPLLIWHIYGM